MTVQLSIFDLLTLQDSSECISSPGSAAGIIPSTSLDGLGQSGRDLAPASPSRSPARRKASATNATSGPSSETLSPSDALQQSLESRLRALLNGSDLCEVTWKPWATPWGRSLFKPRARVRTIFGTDTGSWPTPTTRDHKDGGYCPNVPVNGLLGRMVWPTPTSLAPAKNGNNEAGNSAGLVAIRSHALAAETWPTPTATHRVRDEETLAKCAAFRKRNANQNTVPLYLAEVATNSAGSSVPTEKPGALNPEFVCWLMGYPTEWVSCGVSVTRSTPARPRRSSVRS